MKVEHLSVGEIRGQLLDGSQPITAHVLKSLGRDPRQGVRKIYEHAKRRYEKERAERVRLDSMLNFERLLWRTGVKAIAGVDEVGVGPLAGPVVAAAVVFPWPTVKMADSDDSFTSFNAYRGRGSAKESSSGREKPKNL